MKKLELKFNPAAISKKKKTSKGKRISPIVHCVCTKSEDGEYKAILRIVSNAQRVTNMSISFTVESYSTRDKERVFSIKPDKTGKKICYIRTKSQAMLAPKKSNLYTPFCEDWVYSGHIVRIGKLLYFDIKEAIWHKDFYNKDLDIKEDELKI